MLEAKLWCENAVPNRAEFIASRRSWSAGRTIVAHACVRHIWTVSQEPDHSETLKTKCI